MTFDVSDKVLRLDVSTSSEPGVLVQLLVCPRTRTSIQLADHHFVSRYVMTRLLTDMPVSWA